MCHYIFGCDYTKGCRPSDWVSVGGKAQNAARAITNIENEHQSEGKGKEGTGMHAWKTIQSKPCVNTIFHTTMDIEKQQHHNNNNNTFECYFFSGADKNVRGLSVSAYNIRGECMFECGISIDRPNTRQNSNYEVHANFTTRANGRNCLQVLGGIFRRDGVAFLDTRWFFFMFIIVLFCMSPNIPCSHQEKKAKKHDAHCTTNNWYNIVYMRA